MSFLNSLEQKQARIGAVILAGGLARRMGGQDKGLIQINGQTMVSLVLAAIHDQVHQTLINANRNHDTYAQLGCEVVADRHAIHRLLIPT